MAVPEQQIERVYGVTLHVWQDMAVDVQGCAAT